MACSTLGEDESDVVEDDVRDLTPDERAAHVGEPKGAGALTCGARLVGQSAARLAPLVLLLAGIVGCGSSGGSGPEAKTFPVAKATNASINAESAQEASAAARTAKACLRSPVQLAQVRSDVLTLVLATAQHAVDRYHVASRMSDGITAGNLLVASQSLRACARAGGAQQGDLRTEAAVIDAARLMQIAAMPTRAQARRNVAQHVATQHALAYVVYRAGGMSIMYVMSRAKRSTAAMISDYASQIVGKLTPVECIKMPGDLGQTIQTFDAATGESTFDPTIYLAPETCHALNQLMHGMRTFNGANAVLTLQHEAEHIFLNSDNEGVVECNALKHISGALRLFHADTKKMRHFVDEGHLGSAPQYLTDPHCKLTEPHIGPVARKKG